MLLAMAVFAAACNPAPTGLPSLATAVPGTPVATTPTATEVPSPVPTPGATAGVAQGLKVSTLPLHLPVAVSRAVAFADGSALLLAGGLTPSGTTDTVLRIDIAGGKVAVDGHLARAVHDTGGAVVAGSPVVFGGGNVVPETVVQRYDGGQGTVVGQLPRARADLVAIDVDDRTVVIGGGTPARLDKAVLTTSDGASFQTVAALLDGVRYPAVAAIGGSILVVGGTDGVHDLAEMQAVDLTTGAVRIIGHLPHGLSHAAALLIAGRLLIAGGRDGGVAQDTIWEVDPASGTVRAVGHLPRAVSDMAVVVVGDVGYLIGGERSAIVTSIFTISLA